MGSAPPSLTLDRIEGPGSAGEGASSKATIQSHLDVIATFQGGENDGSSGPDRLKLLEAYRSEPAVPGSALPPSREEEEAKAEAFFAGLTSEERRVLWNMDSEALQQETLQIDHMLERKERAFDSYREVHKAVKAAKPHELASLFEAKFAKLEEQVGSRDLRRLKKMKDSTLLEFLNQSNKILFDFALRSESPQKKRYDKLADDLFNELGRRYRDFLASHGVSQVVAVRLDKLSASLEPLVKAQERFGKTETFLAFNDYLQADREFQTVSMQLDDVNNLGKSAYLQSPKSYIHRHFMKFVDAKNAEVAKSFTEDDLKRMIDDIEEASLVNQKPVAGKGKGKASRKADLEDADDSLLNNIDDDELKRQELKAKAEANIASEKYGHKKEGEKQMQLLSNNDHYLFAHVLGLNNMIFEENKLLTEADVYLGDPVEGGAFVELTERKFGKNEQAERFATNSAVNPRGEPLFILAKNYLPVCATSLLEINAIPGAAPVLFFRSVKELEAARNKFDETLKNRVNLSQVKALVEVGFKGSSSAHRAKEREAPVAPGPQETKPEAGIAANKSLIEEVLQNQGDPTHRAVSLWRNVEKTKYKSYASSVKPVELEATLTANGLATIRIEQSFHDDAKKFPTGRWHMVVHHSGLDFTTEYSIYPNGKRREALLAAYSGPFRRESIEEKIAPFRP